MNVGAGVDVGTWVEMPATAEPAVSSGVNVTGTITGSLLCIGLGLGGWVGNAAFGIMVGNGALSQIWQPVNNPIIRPGRSKCQLRRRRERPETLDNALNPSAQWRSYAQVGLIDVEACLEL